MRFRIFPWIIIILVLIALAPSKGWTDLVPPTLSNPLDGDVIQLSAPPNQLTLAWSNVADATGYRVVLEGPSDFGEALMLFVEQTAASTVTRNINNLVTGTYTWTVASLLGEEVAESAPFFFTVQTGSTGGGDLPAPALLLVPDYQLLRADSAQIRFQWTRVDGAAGYRFGLNPPEGGFINVQQPSSGTTVVTELPFTSAQAGTYIWSVTPFDSQSRLGAGSKQRHFLITPIDGAAWDLDESGGTSPGDLFAFAARWHEGFTAADLDADRLTGASDLTILFEAQRNGFYPPPTPIPGFVAPGQISPTTGSNHSSTNVQFIWQPLVGAIGYEFNLLDDNPNSNIVRVLEKPTSGNVATTFGFLQPRPRSWRVRAYFGTGVVGPYSGAIPFNVTN